MENELLTTVYNGSYWLDVTQNAVPKTPQQALTIQNIKDDMPIQLRVDTVTDYTALIISFFVSIITALISAGVTIIIVARSNKELQNTQIDLQSKLLVHEKERELHIVTSDKRQDWINSIRTDISSIISETYSSIYDPRIISNSRDINSDIILEFISNFKKVEELIFKVELFLNREEENHILLIDNLNDLRNHLTYFFNYNDNGMRVYIYKDQELLELIKSSIENIKLITQIIIKIEWEKIKTGK